MIAYLTSCYYIFTDKRGGKSLVRSSALCSRITGFRCYIFLGRESHQGIYGLQGLVLEGTFQCSVELVYGGSSSEQHGSRVFRNWLS